jgi:hypothetical protein
MRLRSFELDERQRLVSPGRLDEVRLSLTSVLMQRWKLIWFCVWPNPGGAGNVSNSRSRSRSRDPAARNASPGILAGRGGFGSVPLTTLQTSERKEADYLLLPFS